MAVTPSNHLTCGKDTLILYDAYRFCIFFSNKKTRATMGSDTGERNTQSILDVPGICLIKPLRLFPSAGVVSLYAGKRYTTTAIAFTMVAPRLDYPLFTMGCGPARNRTGIAPFVQVRERACAKGGLYH